MSLLSDPPHVITIEGPPTAVGDGNGGTTIAWPTVRAANVPCLISTVSPREQQRFAQDNLLVTNSISFNGNAEGIQRGDRLVTPEGTYFRVHGIRVQRGVGGIDTWTLVYAEELL